MGRPADWGLICQTLNDQYDFSFIEGLIELDVKSVSAGTFKRIQDWRFSEGWCDNPNFSFKIEFCKSLFAWFRAFENYYKAIGDKKP